MKPQRNETILSALSTDKHSETIVLGLLDEDYISCLRYRDLHFEIQVPVYLHEYLDTCFYNIQKYLLSYKKKVGVGFEVQKATTEEIELAFSASYANSFKIPEQGSYNFDNWDLSDNSQYQLKFKFQ